jgi:hypothetical protein
LLAERDVLGVPYLVHEVCGPLSDGKRLSDTVSIFRLFMKSLVLGGWKLELTLIVNGLLDHCVV